MPKALFYAPHLQGSTNVCRHLTRLQLCVSPPYETLVIYIHDLHLSMQPVRHQGSLVQPANVTSMPLCLEALNDHSNSPHERTFYLSIPRR
jgi:hypothetical protein